MPKESVNTIAPQIPSTSPQKQTQPQGQTAQVVQTNETDFLKQLYEKNVELLEERRRIEQLLYNVSEAVFSINSKFEIKMINRFAENMLSVGATSALGKDINDFIKLQTEKGDAINIKDYCFSEKIHNSLDSLILTTINSQYYVNIKTSTIEFSPEKKECLVTMTNITKEKMLEKTKNDFVSVTSHELRTPMTIIKSYVWMLGTEKAGAMSAKQKEYLDKIARGADRMLALINDTLSISRIERGKIDFKIEKVDITDLLTEMETEFKLKTDEKHISLAVNIAKDVSSVYADPNKLREVITNLVGNSVKFTSKGGITVDCNNMTGNKFVKISINDTGKGIRTEDLESLFHKFGRLDNSYTTIAEAGGTGLGLYIVKSMVEAMGGQVGATSEGIGKGSTFWFTLPTSPVKTGDIKVSKE